MKTLNSICDNCESEFSLTFNKNLVKEVENIRCPFCNAIIEESEEEEVQDEFDLFRLNGGWDE